MPIAELASASVYYERSGGGPSLIFAPAQAAITARGGSRSRTSSRTSTALCSITPVSANRAGHRALTMVLSTAMPSSSSSIICTSTLPQSSPSRWVAGRRWACTPGSHSVSRHLCSHPSLLQRYWKHEQTTPHCFRANEKDSPQIPARVQSRTGRARARRESQIARALR